MANWVEAQGEVIMKDHLSLDKLRKELELAGFSIEVNGAYANLRGRLIPGGMNECKKALADHLDEGSLRFTSEEGSSWTWEIRGGKLTEPTSRAKSWWGRLLNRL